MEKFFVTLFLMSDVLLGQIPDTIYMPLHVDNKWQYIITTIDPDGASYSSSSSVVAADTVIGDSTYYKIDNKFFRYSIAEKRLYAPWNDTPRIYIDYSVPNGNTYQSFRNGQYVTVTSESGTNNIFNILRPYGGYLYINSNWGIRQRYSDSIGLTFQREAGFHFESYKNIIAAVIYDSSGVRNYTEGYKPYFQITPIVSIDTAAFDLSFSIGHHFNYLLPPGAPPWHSGLDFIDSVKMFSYYSNGDSTIELDPIIPFHSTNPVNLNYRVTTVLNTSLMKNGYSFYYRFTARDKCIIPGISLAPSDSEYYKCDWDFPTGTDPVINNNIDFSLQQNFPNPFNPSTTISYSVPEYSNVTLKIYNVLGIEIETLIDEEKPAGKYEITWNAADLPSDVYFYRLQTGAYVETKKMILMK